MAERVQLFVEDDIHIVELCAPPKNLTDQLFFQEFSEILDRLQKNASALGVIIRSQGNHFSSGADVDELVELLAMDTDRRTKEFLARSLMMTEGLSKLGKPVVAAIQGCCLGSGLELALHCHFRIGAKNALFAMPESGYNLIPGWGGTYRLPRLIGKGKAIEMILTGKNYLAEDALKIGLIDSVVPKKQLQKKAKEVVRRLAGAVS